ncbi:DUF255 domain-containing protein [Enterobacteriaceae bacterium 89]|nr:DUF255 domain-containing protein [Enterobacteriaceae bacterium 89]
MRILFRQLVLCLLWLWLPFAQAADSGWLRSADNDHASVRLRAAPQQNGETRVLLDVALEKGWKTYWRSPGEGGIAPAIKWQTPLEMDWRWPAPQRFDVAGISTQGYHGNVTFPITLHGTMPDKLTGVLTLSTCSNVCILTDYPFTLDLNAPADNNFSYDFTRAMGTLPLKDGLTSELTAGYSNGKLMVSATREAGWQQPELFIDTFPDTDFGKPSYKIDGATLTATLPVSDGWGETAPDLRGKTLSLLLSDGGQAQESQVTVGQAIDSPQAFSLWWVLLMALAGGLILNVMPCVLPVLAMKLGSVVQLQSADRRRVRQQFIASAVGIITSFLALALMMTLLRLSNQALGWGIQFQNPWFIGGMTLVMVLFGASLLGLFEFRLSSGASTFLATRGGNGLAGHFWQGALATLLATPCTAPFLGTAVSVALVAPLPLLWGLFFVMGIGMSLPWLLIAIWPGLALRLPRPGRWMNTVKVALGLMMLGSALWLGSLLAVHVGQTLTFALISLVTVLMLAATFWRFGRRAGALSALLAVALLATAFQLMRPQSNGLTADRVNWQPLSEQAIAAALAENKRVFVDVTADWCVTCKANKYNVLLREEVQQALTAPDIVALRGDWTQPSDTISQFLRARNSVAVPFNQIYGPGMKQGQIQPPLLSRDHVLQTLDKAKGQ